MSRSGLRPSVRVAAFALLGMIWAFADARPARAMGCHVADRPTLGLSDPWGFTSLAEGATTGLLADRPTPRVFPKPCSGDVPGSPERQGAAQSPALALAGAVADPPPYARFVIPDPLVRPIRLPDDRDRPPRRHPRLA